MLVRGGVLRCGCYLSRSTWQVGWTLLRRRYCILLGLVSFRTRNTLPLVLTECISKRNVLASVTMRRTTRDDGDISRLAQSPPRRARLPPSAVATSAGVAPKASQAMRLIPAPCPCPTDAGCRTCLQIGPQAALRRAGPTGQPLHGGYTHGIMV